KDEKEELATVIQDYRTGTLPLLAPLTLIKHYLNAYQEE
ncbi:YbgA family protein, partial [Escherichia coli]|nr:YbgA family protein [Escherichia coli]